MYFLKISNEFASISGRVEGDRDATPAPHCGWGEPGTAVEVVNASYAVANTIRDGRTHQLINLIQSGRKTA